MKLILTTQESNNVGGVRAQPEAALVLPATSLADRQQGGGRRHRRRRHDGRRGPDRGQGVQGALRVPQKSVPLPLT